MVVGSWELLDVACSGPPSLTTTLSSPLTAWSEVLNFQLLACSSCLDGSSQKKVASVSPLTPLVRHCMGVVFDLSDSAAFKCKVSNTMSRVEQISEIAKLLDSGHVTQHDAQKLRGRMQFVEPQIY